MKTTRDTLLALLILCSVNVQSAGGVPRASIAPVENTAAISDIEKLIFQTFSSQQILEVNTGDFIKSLPITKQKAIRDFYRAALYAQSILPNEIKTLENSLDKLEISVGAKYYFLYRFFNRITKAQIRSYQCLAKSADSGFPQAIFEWVFVEALNTSRSEKELKEAIRLLQKIKNPQENKEAQLFLATLSLRFPETSLTGMSIEEAIEFVIKNKEYIISLKTIHMPGYSVSNYKDPHNIVFLYAAINSLILDKELQNIEKVIPLFTEFINTEEHFYFLVKVFYLFRKLNIKQPDFIQACRKRIYDLAMAPDGNCNVASGYLGSRRLNTPEILGRINNSADIENEFLEVLLEEEEKKMKDKEFNLIEFFWGPKVEKETEELDLREFFWSPTTEKEAAEARVIEYFWGAKAEKETEDLFLKEFFWLPTTEKEDVKAKIIESFFAPKEVGETGGHKP